MNRVRALTKIAAYLIVLPLPFLWLIAAFPKLAFLRNLAFQSSAIGIVLAITAIVDWIALDRAMRQRSRHLGA